MKSKKAVGRVVIDRSFDENIVTLTKTLEDGDFEELLRKEGEYLDELVSIVKEKASSGEGFSVTFMVEVEKEL